MDTPRHEEFTPLAPWARLLTWGVIGFGLWTVLAYPPGDGAAPSLAAAGILALGVLIEAVLGGLRVRLFADRIEVALGRVGWIRKSVAYERVAWIEAVTYRPLRDFGGWGVRGFGPKQAWTARGNRAVVMHLTDGAQLYVGAEHPERLAERMRAVARQPWSPPVTE